MTQTTSKRDEAVLSVDALAQEIRRVDGSHSLGAGALAEALMPFLLTSAPAPASGRVDAVAVSRMDVVIALREWFGGERYARDYEYLDMQMGPQMKATLEAVFKDRRERASLSPAATPVEAGGEIERLAKEPGCEADAATVFREALKLARQTAAGLVDAPRIPTCGPIAPMNEQPDAERYGSESPGEPATVGDLFKPTLAKPASSPAGGDVVQTLIDKTEKLIEAADDMGWSCNSSSADQAIREAKDAVRAVLSQSTSAGRVGE